MSATPRPSGAERREFPRVPAAQHIHATVDDAAQDVTIVDLSQGGFLLESGTPFPVGAIHQFRVALRDGRWMTLLTARSMHVRPRAGASRHLTGFAFVEPLGDEARARVRTLVQHVTSVVSY
jgi:hypothetical protein